MGLEEGLGVGLDEGLGVGLEERPGNEAGGRPGNAAKKCSGESIKQLHNLVTTGTSYAGLWEWWSDYSLFQVLCSFSQWTVGEVVVIDHENIKHHKTLLHS